MSITPADKFPGASPWKTVFVLLAVCVALVWSGVICFNMAMDDFFHGFFVGNPGAINSSADWPEPLKKLVEDTKSANLNVDVFEVHCMCKGYEREYIWRMNANSDLVDFLIKRWKLSPAKFPDHGIFCGKSMLSGDSAPDWWAPKDNADTQFYVCKLSLEGGKGERFHIAHDKKRNCLFVWYWDNW